MPEGPEVRHYADELSQALEGKPVLEVSARTKAAKAWLVLHESELIGKTIERIYARGKNIVGIIGGGYYFYSHQMMWGSWSIVKGEISAIKDKRERARIVTRGCAAILMSAPVFEIGQGDPIAEVPFLNALGPDVLPYAPEKFDEAEFVRRLRARKHSNTPIGAALLDQTILAGLGNYLRAEILFLAKLNPWKKVNELSDQTLKTLCTLIPKLVQRSYKEHRTVTHTLQKRMESDSSLVYVPGKEYGTRHYVFRRTNLPCLICQNPIKQLRQPMGAPDLVQEEETLTRIVYFCPQCQKVDMNEVALKKKSLRQVDLHVQKEPG